MSFTFDSQEMITRLVKYLIEGLAVALVAFLLGKQLTGYDIALLALVAASVFSVLDLLAPSISGTVRSGVGYGVGFQLAGFP
jgi:hypothetical protein